ncbi:hypothetical protein [Propioniciclava flava]
MDANLIHLLIASVTTVVCVIITALIWRRAQVKTVFWWIGLTLLPMAIYLAGLGSAAEGAARSFYAWWNGLQFTPIQWVGLVLGGIGALLLVGSRLIPSESAKDRRARSQSREAGGLQRASSLARPARHQHLRTGLPPPEPAATPPAAGGESESRRDERTATQARHQLIGRRGSGTSQSLSLAQQLSLRRRVA